MVVAISQQDVEYLSRIYLCWLSTLNFLLLIAIIVWRRK
jgi:hypothetical protein